MAYSHFLDRGAGIFGRYLFERGRAGYGPEPKGRVNRHEILMGLLSTSPELRRDYLPDENLTYSDNIVYLAVNQDLKARDDASSPMVRRMPNGDPIVDLALPGGWNEYERLVRSLTLRIILHHPIAVLETLPTKIKDQIRGFDHPAVNSMAWANLRMFVIVVAVGALICTMAGKYQSISQCSEAPLSVRQYFCCSLR